jgi:hypothetical protein
MTTVAMTTVAARVKVLAAGPPPHDSAATRTTSATAAIVRTVDRVIDTSGTAGWIWQQTYSRFKRSAEFSAARKPGTASPGGSLCADPAREAGTSSFVGDPGGI